MTGQDTPNDSLETAFAAFREAWLSGKSVDPDSFCKGHPKCGPELRERIQNYLLVAGLFPEEEQLGDGVQFKAPSEGETPPFKTLGDFRLLREIGRGGMGVVYEAEQISLNRKVALKVLPPHLSFSTDTVMKFHREAEAGGRQSHPGIVAIHAVGEHEGVHYIAQEFIKGGLTLADKLESFRKDGKQPPGYFRDMAKLTLDVANALHHAHESKVIHRDIKPSNILLTPDGQPKVADFGLAKIEDALALSRTGDFSGTPYYMSPEQALSRKSKIDKRTDIYSLGATLYELLTLNPPFEGETSHEVLKKVIFIDPENPLKANPRVPRDLSIICLKAMEKNPDRRYQDMKTLCDDLKRFLDGDVIQAKPAGLGIRVWKGIKRNPLVSTATSVSLLAIISFIAYILFVSYPQINHEKDVAEAEKQKALAAEKQATQEQERANVEAEKARSEAEATKAVLDFLVGLFESSSPEETLGADITVKEVFDRGVGQVTERFEDRPLIRAKLLKTMGNVYVSLGQYSEAEPLFKEALELRRSNLDKEHLGSLGIKSELATLYRIKGQYEEAEPLFLEVLDVRRRLQGNENLDTLKSINNVALLYLAQGRYDEAEPLFLEVFEGFRKVLGKDHPDSLVCMQNLAFLYKSHGRYKDAEPLYLEALEGKRRTDGDDHPDTLAIINLLANLYTSTGEYTKAEQLYIECLEDRRQVLGNDHLHTLILNSNLADLYEKQARYKEAESLYLESLEGIRETLGSDYFGTLVIMADLAGLYATQGRYKEAEPLLLEALEKLRSSLGEAHSKTLGVMNDLGLLYFNQGRYEEAEPLFLDALEKKRSLFGDDHPMTLTGLHNLGLLYQCQSRYEEAEPLLLEALEGSRQRVGNDHPDIFNNLNNLAILYAKQGRYIEAECLLIESIDGYRRQLGQTHPDTLSTVYSLVNLYLMQNRYKEAEPLAQDLLEHTPKDDKEYKTRMELLDKIKAKLAEEGPPTNKESEE